MNTAGSIQGHEILSYEVDVKNGYLILHTMSPECRAAEVRFAGVCAHDFNNVLCERNCLEGVEELEYARFREQYAAEIPAWQESGFPVGEAVYEKGARKGRMRIYEVRSKEGLRGVVFAREMEIRDNL